MGLSVCERASDIDGLVQEKLLDESLMNEQNILDKITKLKDENIQKYNGDVAELQKTELNINNERMELEDKQEDLGSTINAAIEKRIAEKERKDEELREKRKREAHEIVEKKRLESEMAAKERLTKPKQPTFDRSAKPQFKFVNKDLVIRNFSGQGRAVTQFIGLKINLGPGLTGPENIANNCYMNNIVQCLSNTNDSVEYFLSKKYKNHIYRFSATHGRVAEELSALFNELWCKEYAHIRSIDFRNTVGYYHPMFSGADHQDSHEFLRLLIDWMHLDAYRKL